MFTDWERGKLTARVWREMIAMADRKPYSPQAVRLIQALTALAELTEAAETLPSGEALKPLFDVLADEMQRLPE